MFIYSVNIYRMSVAFSPRGFRRLASQGKCSVYTTNFAQLSRKGLKTPNLAYVYIYIRLMEVHDERIQYAENILWSCMYVNATNKSTNYSDIIMSAMTSQMTSVTIVYSGADQRKHQTSASQAFVRGIHQRPMNSPHQGPVTQKMFTFDDDIIFGAWHEEWCREHRIFHPSQDWPHALRALQGPFHRIYELIIQILQIFLLHFLEKLLSDQDITTAQSSSHVQNCSSM